MSEFWIVRLHLLGRTQDLRLCATLKQAKIALYEEQEACPKTDWSECKLHHYVSDGADEFDEVDYLEPKGFGLLPRVDDKQAGVFIGHPGGGGGNAPLVVKNKDELTLIGYGGGGMENSSDLP